MSEKSGMLVSMYCRTFESLQIFVLDFVQSGSVRCLSPSRKKPCDNAATNVFWQDRAEWYPCCGDHLLEGPQWAGSTGFVPHRVELVVIPDKAEEFMNSLDERYRNDIQVEYYDREAELQKVHGKDSN